MGMTDSYLMRLGIEDEKRVTRHDSPLEAKTAECRELFAAKFIDKALDEPSGVGFKVSDTNGHAEFVPGLVLDMAINAIYSFDNFEAGIEVVLSAVQLCARKGDVDALRAVGTLAQAWAVENAKGLL
jgi:hypothetical protein